MKLRYLYILCTSFALAVMAASCGNEGAHSHGPIILGDSSTIVTEPDTQYLRDMVADFHPNIPSPTEQADSAQNAAQQPVADTTKPTTTAAPAQPAQAKPEPTGKGLTVAFKDVTIFIPNIETKTYRAVDLSKANGASYQLLSGNLNGNQLKITNGNIVRVSQHYQTSVVIKNELGTLPLDALSSTTGWQPLKGGNGTYTISGLDARKLQYPQASAAQIRKAVERAARAHRFSRRREQEWLNSIRHVRSVNQAPLTVVLRSVVWKVEGKDAQGKPYQKQLRIDMPLENNKGLLRGLYFIY